MAASALLVMDFQHDIVNLHESGGSLQAVAQARKAVDAARSRNMPVIFVRVAYRTGFLDASARNKRVSFMKQKGILLESSSGAQIVAELGATADDALVTKRRVSALSNTDLRPLLTSFDVDKLIMCGLSTSGAVLSTVRQAVDEDYSVVVLSDACADADAEMHDILMRKIFPSQCDVATVAETFA